MNDRKSERYDSLKKLMTESLFYNRIFKQRYQSQVLIIFNYASWRSGYIQMVLNFNPFINHEDHHYYKISRRIWKEGIKLFSNPSWYYWLEHGIIVDPALIWGRYRENPQYLPQMRARLTIISYSNWQYQDRFGKSLASYFQIRLDIL